MAQRFERARVILVVFVALIALRFGGPVAAADSSVSFDIGVDVSTEDATYVREGMSLAQRYVAETLTDISETPIRVAVFAGDDFFCGEEAIACATASSIVVLTGTPDWDSQAPFERVATIVHEYIHVYQHAMLDDDMELLPAWFVEGMASYLAWDAVVGLGLVPAQDVHDYQTLAVKLSPELAALDDMEDREAFDNESSAAYGLAYLAIEELMEGYSPADLDRFLAQVHRFHEWRISLQRVLGQDANLFYRAFATKRDDLSIPMFLPEPFALLTPQFFESSIQITSVKGSFEEGEQMTVLGHSDAAAVCRIRLESKQSGEELTQSTFADGSGHLFWLITIPDDFGEGIAIITAGCGGEPNHTAIDITS